MKQIITKTKKAIKPILRPLLNQDVVNALHYPEALIAARQAQQPTRDMIVIGIVGSKGKTTTANMLWSILQASGHKTGLIGTANIRVGDHEELNKYHMTMPESLALQQIFARMKKSDCRYVVLEVPSEGQTQWRHIGIHFDLLLFTNVTRELMASHKYSQDILHQHNSRVFKYLKRTKKKRFDGEKIAKTIVANADAADFSRYFSYPAEHKYSFSIRKKSDFRAEHIKSTASGTSFSLRGQEYAINIAGPINVINATGAIAAAASLGLEPAVIARGLENLKSIPGRMEVIEAGQSFRVIVDYAHEETSMTALMEAGKSMRQAGSKIITLLGAEGGGRDEKKRPIMGKIAASTSDYVVISNVDPYDDDPATIIETIAAGARTAGKIEDKNLFCIEDRRAGINKALSLAAGDDIVLITGKGSEQSMVIGDKKLPWDDRQVVREELEKIVKTN